MINKILKLLRKRDNNSVLKNDVKVNNNKYNAQEIFELLTKVKKYDSSYRQFGANKHKYRLNPPISAKLVRSIETRYNFKLPEDYFWFITEVGNGGAGPYYGIVPFDVNDAEKLSILGKETFLSPMESKEKYDEFINGIDLIDNDEEYDKVCKSMEHGLLYIGTQGCTMKMNLVMSGEHRGKIIYTDDDWQRPYYSYGDSFVEWYINWIKEILLGYDMSWYGSKMFGNELDLINRYKSDDIVKLEVLRSMFKFPNVTDEINDFLYNQYQITGEEDEKDLIFKLLIKFEHPRVREIIMMGLESDQPDKYVYLIATYQKGSLNDWYEILLGKIESFSEKCIEDMFWKIFIHCEVKPQSIVDLFKSKNANVRAAAIGNIFRFADKNEYIDEIIPYLSDVQEVAIRSVYMTHDSHDLRLVPIYIKLLEDYEKKNEEETKFARHYISKFLEEHA